MSTGLTHHYTLLLVEMTSLGKITSDALQSSHYPVSSRSNKSASWASMSMSASTTTVVYDDKSSEAPHAREGESRITWKMWHSDHIINLGGRLGADERLKGAELTSLHFISFRTSIQTGLWNIVRKTSLIANEFLNVNITTRSIEDICIAPNLKQYFQN